MRSRKALVTIAGVAGCLGPPVPAVAQAWLPMKHEATVSATFQRVDADGHFLEDGSKLPGYRTRASNAVVEAGFGITDRLAIGLTVPFVNVKYLGPDEPLNLPDNVLDDGRYHGTLTDLRLELRYNPVQRPVVFTPFVAAVVPSHSYPTLGEAAPGRDFQEYHLGAYTGRLLDPVLPRAFVHGSYAYAFVRQDLDIPLDYSSLSLETGYFVTPQVAIGVSWRRLWTHGGLSFNELFVAPPEVFVNLDRVVRVKSDHVGVTASFPLGASLSAHANYIWFVDGVDAHYGSGFSVGLSWRRRPSTGIREESRRQGAARWLPLADPPRPEGGP